MPLFGFDNEGNSEKDFTVTLSHEYMITYNDEFMLVFKTNLNYALEQVHFRGDTFKWFGKKLVSFQYCSIHLQVEHNSREKNTDH